MARKNKPIKTVSYVHQADGSLVRLSDLPDKTRQEVGLRLMTEYLNVLYRGKAEFFADPKYCARCNMKLRI